MLRVAVLPLAVLAACCAPAAGALASTGGTSADVPASTRASGALPFAVPGLPQPVARVFRVGGRRSVAVEGRAPRVEVRIDEEGVPRVRARVVAIDLATRRTAARFDLGAIRTGSTVRERWPAGQPLAPGTYLVRLHARDPAGAVLVRAASFSGKVRLVVRPRTTSTPPPAPASVPLVAPVDGGVFPVRGAHSFGGGQGRFGAGRPGHAHEGQDIAAAEGTPVVAPLAGTVTSVDRQPRSAGNYVVVDTDDGRAFFFCHLQDGSTAVQEGQRVTAGQLLGRVGQTGRASGPHLHFEIWEGGWRDRGGRPVDPLAQLRAWQR